MNRNRAELRKNRLKKIKQRIRLIKHQWGFGQYPFEEPLLLDSGKYANNNYTNMGTPVKTNVRKAHSNYRRPGGYGPDKNWSPHDQRQVDDMGAQEEELNKEYKE